MSQKKPGNFATWFGIAVGSYVGYLFSAVCVMFSTALVHKEIAAVPALSYWGAFGSVWLLASIGAGLNTWQLTRDSWKAAQK